MTKYRVYATTTASAAVDVEVPDGVTDPEEISELAFAKGLLPNLSAQASGWGQPWSIDLGEWEPEIVDGVSYVTNEADEQVTEAVESDA
jgi:hypothetical protein